MFKSNDFLPEGKDVIHTHFGRIEDLRKDNSTNQNNDQLGYTDAEVCRYKTLITVFC